jgi:hypothetical protein
LAAATRLPNREPQVARELEPSRLGNVRQVPPAAHDADLECCQALDGLMDDDVIKALARGEIDLMQACDALVGSSDLGN